MNRLWSQVQAIFLPALDVILPERERAARVRKRTMSDFTLVPTEHSLLSARVTTLLDYRDPAVTDLVRALKYEHSGHAAKLCAEVLADYLQEDISNMRRFSAREILLVPMPLHESRVRERGFNQMQKVLSHLPKEFSDGSLCRTSHTALIRTRATQQQARLSRSERLRNVSDAFEADESVRGTHVILVDDVTTTGATLISAAKTLRKAGARVSLLALARA